MEGFSLHAAVRCGAEDHRALEQLLRYMTRPALASDRVQFDAARQVVLNGRQFAFDLHRARTAWRRKKSALGTPSAAPSHVGADGPVALTLSGPSAPLSTG
jgi:hypothetical protein